MMIDIDLDFRVQILLLPTKGYFMIFKKQRYSCNCMCCKEKCKSQCYEEGKYECGSPTSVVVAGESLLKL